MAASAKVAARGLVEPTAMGRAEDRVAIVRDAAEPAVAFRVGFRGAL